MRRLLLPKSRRFDEADDLVDERGGSRTARPSSV
jgi:hypothetical protein